MLDTNEVAISHLQRRKIEGRVLIPFIQVLRDKFGEKSAADVVDETIRRLAARKVRDGRRPSGKRRHRCERWRRSFGRAAAGMDVEVLGESNDHLDFNVTRCQYAEFYKELGLSDLGFRIHCNRDHAMVVGFNDELELSRSQTIMEGASCCDFRFRRKSPAIDKPAE